MDTEPSAGHAFTFLFLLFLSFLTEVLFMSASIWLLAIGNFFLWNMAHSFIINLFFTAWVVPVSLVARGWIKFYWVNVLKED